ncbi:MULTISPECIES: hypothetical protein [Streptomyces]|uniref:Uncharacterized protein n=1 Tax=Streptomyces autolyticus TaxID=75293 RepID=A0ABN4W6Z7_9ACTN|nr:MULTISPECIES: hypothetical protein [Streptomyces]AQA13038.1 hypothetical protein BV401_23965 [Streptomyces autolyticus]MCC4318666.1 hypothetical protein [Streptomyces malaysiensis]MCD9591608.1 hypothetical protein [Streptomyces sp. 8ZJF_21]MCM3811414.1 hypothetical protein [Streptomyces sp. DR7-3]
MSIDRRIVLFDLFEVIALAPPGHGAHGAPEAPTSTLAGISRRVQGAWERGGWLAVLTVVYRSF